MIVQKGINLAQAIRWSIKHIIMITVFVGGVALLYYYGIVKVKIPWLPVSVIGTAVAFYVGFKNNQSYDRLWEARKIWGGIINDSRTWGMFVDGYISNLFTENKVSEEEIKSIKKRLIYRHIGWIYAHRSQLLIPTPWEHISQRGHVKKTAQMYQKRYGIGLLGDEKTRTELKLFLPEDELERLINHANTATQIINEQSRDLKELRERDLIEDFRLTAMMEVLRSFYTLQGKNERIKKFPLPRQFANLSRIFVFIFVALLPFSMIPELQESSSYGLWLAIPCTMLVSWVYLMMEFVGDYTENPFQGMANDIPMLSLCRVIEIDLREMLGETDLPPKVEAKNGILM